MKRLVIAVAVLWSGVVLESAESADIAVVKCTIAAKDAGKRRGYDMHREAVTKKLLRCGVAFDLVSDEQVIAGKLTDYRLAIFPFNTVSDAEEVRQILAFTQGGGRLVWFYSFPRQLSGVLGIDKCSYRGKSRDGEFFTMKFIGDRPPGFPAQVYQESPNCRIVEKVAEGSRALALWYDKDGKNTGIPAVILSPASIYIAHVLWGGADADQQTQFLLASIGHFLPEQWTKIVTGMLEKASTAAGYENLDLLTQAVAQSPAAKRWAKEATTQARRTKECLAARKYSEALTLASQVHASAQNAAVAVFPSRPYELRGAWLHPNDTTDWEATMAELKAANFNAVFPLMCGPESTKYPSAYAKQLTQRDHMKECLDAARRHGIEVHVWKANWQVLRPVKELSQKFTDEKRFVLSAEQVLGQPEKSSYRWSTRWLDPSEERNRQLEYDMLVELVEKYHPHGIHFDFMRYPASSYCYCERCREKFQQWAAVRVEQWPQDCMGKGVQAERFRQWRRHLQTSLVKRIAEGVRRIDPQVKLSLAARASMTGSYDSDAQDWVTWSKEGYLDFLCPMDYTDRVDVLRRKLEPQVAAINGVVPIYAGLGVSPTRSATAVNLSQQIQLARELGADGFLMFAWSPFSAAMLPMLQQGPTSTPVTVMPHHRQPVTVLFQYPPVSDGAPARTYLASKTSSLSVRIASRTKDTKKITATAVVVPAAGGPKASATAKNQGNGTDITLPVPLPSEAGIYEIIVRGEVTVTGGAKAPFYLRSLPINVVTAIEEKAVPARPTRR